MYCSHMPICFSLEERHSRSSNMLFSCPVVGVKFLAHSCSVIAVGGPAWRAESPDVLSHHVLSHLTRRRCLAYAQGCWLALGAWFDCLTMSAPNWSMAPIAPLLLQNTNHNVCQRAGAATCGLRGRGWILASCYPAVLCRQTPVCSLKERTKSLGLFLG